MQFNALVIRPEDVDLYTVRVDEYNEVRPVPITEGPDKGSFFFDEEILNRFPQLDKTLGPGNRPARVVRKPLDTDIIKKKIATIAK